MPIRAYPVYNLEFPCWCEEFSVAGYTFKRVDDYQQAVTALQHLVEGHAEFSFRQRTGSHQKTAVVHPPESELAAVIHRGVGTASALEDLLLLISLVTGRDVFVFRDAEPGREPTIVADPRKRLWGGLVRLAIPYQRSEKESENLHQHNKGFEIGLSRAFDNLQDEIWQSRYEDGHFLILADGAFRRQRIESAFVQCWTIWEHLFAIRNKHWLSDRSTRRLAAEEKIAFVLANYLGMEVGKSKAREGIEHLVRTRNRLVHFGKMPRIDGVRAVVELFVELTEFVVALALGLEEPKGVMDTRSRLERFFKGEALKTHAEEWNKVWAGEEE